ncbi:PREDICTED: leucine-rich repeat-containing protein 71 [Cyprinodon variegatus]|uniref:leucine-rich repeat-containing protein 71 n=1 Tax=Cyprinodon variegatus TaxID=28743 RepID=UPI000742C868|nr:PREDICTED: leucine-rich repeat-containing protein 71 [Cyprinodon variegatus]
MSRKKGLRDKFNQEAEGSKNAGSNELSAILTFDTYQCTGNVEVDFPALCALLNIKEILAVRTKHPHSTTDKNEGGVQDDLPEMKTLNIWSKPCLNIELENEDPLSAKRMWISGCKVSEQTYRAMQKMLPSMNHLQSLQFWQAGLTDPMVISLTNTTSLCSNLREVSLEGNPLPNLSFHHLLSEDSKFTQVSLRNNRIGDEGARLIGSALSTIKSANKNLLWLNLAFNNIGDEGAAHIAKIGDLGAAHLAEIIGEFSLTHEEVERRKLLFQRIQASAPRADLEQLSSSQLSPEHPASHKKSRKSTSQKEQKSAMKDGKTAAVKEKPHKKASDKKEARSRSVTNGGREKLLPALEDKSVSNLSEAETMETGTPLLDPSVYHKDGKLFLPGNTTLESLNLSGNKITEKSLPLFLASLEKQQEVGGNLWRLCLQGNLFPTDSQCYTQIKEMVALKNPLAKSGSTV